VLEDLLVHDLRLLAERVRLGVCHGSLLDGSRIIHRRPAGFSSTRAREPTLRIRRF
jgi:hypothetical protein